MTGVVEALLEKYGTAIDLKFVRTPSSGLVHVLVPEVPWWDRDENQDERVPWGQVGQAINDARTRLACGARAREDHQGGAAQRVGVFADDDLCAGCHRALGTHADRAFEHPRPGGDV